MLVTRRLSILYKHSLNQTTNHSKATLIPLLYHTRGGTLKKCVVSIFRLDAFKLARVTSCIYYDVIHNQFPPPSRMRPPFAKVMVRPPHIQVV